MKEFGNRQGEITVGMSRFRYNCAAFNDLAPHWDLSPLPPPVSW